MHAAQYAEYIVSVKSKRIYAVISALDSYIVWLVVPRARFLAYISSCLDNEEKPVFVQ